MNCWNCRFVSAADDVLLSEMKESIVIYTCLLRIRSVTVKLTDSVARRINYVILIIVPADKAANNAIII